MAQEAPWKSGVYVVGGLLIITLAVVLSPFVLIAGVVFAGFKIYERQQTSPARLGRLELERHAALYEQAAKPVPLPDAETFVNSVMVGYLPHQTTPPIPQIVSLLPGRVRGALPGRGVRQAP